MTLRFGTDGVRGVANRDLTPEFLVAFARAVTSVLGTDTSYVVGRDTRRSGPSLEAALVAGLTSTGADVELVGVLPTPGVAVRAAHTDAAALVISASHNPAPDNGVKVFSRGGRKLTDADETAIEAALDAVLNEGALVGRDGARPEADGIGVASGAPDAAGRYVMHLMEAMQGRRGEGLRVVVDAAHGAAYDVGPSAIVETGASVHALNVAPDGLNINEGCGSTHPQGMCAIVRETGADVGFAFDGDADRVMAADEDGNVVDGDQILAILALDRHERGLLPGDAIAATVMSNLGLRRALAVSDIAIVETPVGDRHVLDALEEHGLALGGEQSGHIVVTDHAPTGDGVLTAILLLDVMVRTGRALSDLASVMVRVPQILVNVAIDDPRARMDDDDFAEAVRVAMDELGHDGRILVRASGTEPLLRIMVEATEGDRARALAERLALVASP